MTALSAAARRDMKNPDLAKRAVYALGTAATVYHNGLVAWNTTTKRAVAASATTARHILGLARKTAGPGNTAGTVKCEVEWNIVAKFAKGANLTAGFVGANCVVADDNTVTTNTAAGTALVRCRVGELVEIEGTSAWVNVRNFVEGDAVTTS